MPLYDCDCADCGSFRAWAPMDEADRARPCPLCGAQGRRELAAPYLGSMNDTLRRALARSERSMEEPRVVPAKHLAGCGCSLCAHKKAPPGPSRRWALGH